MTFEQRWSRLSSTKTGVSALFLIGFSMVRTHTLHRMYLLLSPFSRAASRRALLYFTCAMVSSNSCASTASSSDGIFARNIWNPITELLFHVQIGGIFVLFVDEIDLARIALSCHFALDLLCDKTGSHDPTIVRGKIRRWFGTVLHRRVERSWRRAS